jgi:hypothetical protein
MGGTVINRALKNLTCSWQIFPLDAKSIDIIRLNTQTAFKIKNMLAEIDNQIKSFTYLILLFWLSPSCKLPLLTTLNS